MYDLNPQSSAIALPLNEHSEDVRVFIPHIKYSGTICTTSS